MQKRTRVRISHPVSSRCTILGDRLRRRSPFWHLEPKRERTSETRSGAKFGGCRSVATAARPDEGTYRSEPGEVFPKSPARGGGGGGVWWKPFKHFQTVN